MEASMATHRWYCLLVIVSVVLGAAVGLFARQWSSVVVGTKSACVESTTSGVVVPDLRQTWYPYVNGRNFPSMARIAIVEN